MQNFLIFDLISEVERILPEIPVTGRFTLKKLVNSLKLCVESSSAWKTALLVAESADLITNGRIPLLKKIKGVLLAGTIATIASGKVHVQKNGPYNEWSRVAKVAAINVPNSVVSVPCGHIPPRVVAYIIRNFKSGDKISFEKAEPSGEPVFLRYSSIISYIPHGSTGSFTLDPRCNKPVMVFTSGKNTFVLYINTVIVHNVELLSTTDTMLSAEGVNCTRMREMVNMAVVATFDTEKFAFYPSDDMATLIDNYVRVNYDNIEDTSEYAKMKLEISESHRCHINRCVALYGAPGNGKTSIAYKVASYYSWIPLVILPVAKILGSKYQLDSLCDYIIMMLKVHKNAIFIIDDLDGCEIVDKNLAATQFISFIDRLNECSQYSNANYVMIVTMNNPKNVSDAIVGRSGRIDRLIEIPYPSEIQIRNQCYRSLDSWLTRKITPLSKFMVKNKFTRADVKNFCDSVHMRGIEPSGVDRMEVAREIADMKKVCKR